MSCPSPLIQASVFLGEGVEKHCPAVLRMTSDRAPWCPNLGEFKWQAWLSESWTLFYNRTAWLLPGRGAKAEESKFPSKPQWCHWPVRRLWPTPVNPCKSDASNLPFWLEYHTFNFRRHPVSEDPITDFNSLLLFFFFSSFSSKTWWQLTSFPTCPGSVREGCLMAPWLASRQRLRFS